MTEMLSLEKNIVRAYSYGKLREMLWSFQSLEMIVAQLLSLFEGRTSHLFLKMRKALYFMSRGKMNLGTEVKVTTDNYVEVITTIITKVVSKRRYHLLRGAFADMLLRAYVLHSGEEVYWGDLRGFTVFNPRESFPKKHVVSLQWPPRPGRRLQEKGEDKELFIVGNVRTNEGTTKWGYFQVRGHLVSFCGSNFPDYRRMQDKDLKQLDRLVKAS